MSFRYGCRCLSLLVLLRRLVWNIVSSSKVFLRGLWLRTVARQVSRCEVGESCVEPIDSTEDAAVFDDAGKH